MDILVSTLPADRVYGIYGANEDPKTEKLRRPYDKLVTRTMPDRLRKMHPDAAYAFMGIADIVVVSDMFRTAESSLKAALTPGKNARMPATSGHNFGKSTDLHVEASIFRLGQKHGIKKPTKADLDEYMESHDFYCHRRDHLDGDEGWHFNYLPAEFRDHDGGIWPKAQSTDGYLQAMILFEYGDQMTLDAFEAQTALQKLEFYDGEIDGKFGKLSTLALTKFQARWHLRATGKLDFHTMRLLSYLTATIVEVPLA